MGHSGQFAVTVCDVYMGHFGRFVVASNDAFVGHYGRVSGVRAAGPSGAGSRNVCTGVKIFNLTAWLGYGIIYPASCGKGDRTEG